MSEFQAAHDGSLLTEVRASTLVVPLDGSVEATAALPIAQTLAAAEGATVHLLYVSDEPVSTRNMAEQLRVSPDQLTGVVLDRRGGPVAHAIVRQAVELSSRLIVMTARCAPPCGRGTLGPTTREVLRQTPCPVVLVPSDQPRVPWALRQILLPHDGVPTTAAAIGRAAQLAQRAHAELAVLHIASSTVPHGEPGALMAPRYLDQPQHEWPTWAREFMDRVMALGGPPPGVRMRLFFDCGEPADVIVKFVAEHHTDMVVIAWVSGWEPEQRTTMRRVIDEAPGPLLILPFEEPAAGMMF